MTREEVLALGVPEERLQEFQKMYGQDLQKAVKRRIASSQKVAVKTAIESMLPLINDAASLREILALVTRLYCMPRSCADSAEDAE